MKTNYNNHIFIVLSLFCGLFLLNSCEEGGEEEFPQWTVTDFSPKGGRPGTIVSIRGSNFGDNPFVAKASMGEQEAPIQVESYSDSVINIVIPYGVAEEESTWPLLLRVWHETKEIGEFAYIPGPTITEVSPLEAEVGEVVTITGKNFGNDQGIVKVYINNNPVEIVEGSFTNNSLQFIVPEESTSGVIKIEVAPSITEGPAFTILGQELPADLISYLMFDGNGDDATENANSATLIGTTSFGEGIIGQGLVLNGEGHATLPEGIMSELDAMTISSYVKLDNIATWMRLWDFGSGTATNAFVTVQAGGTNAPRFAIKNDDSAEQRIDSNAGSLSTGQWYHIAVTYSNNVGILYIDGVEVGRNEDITIKPSDLGLTNQNYIGKAQWPDPLLEGTVDDFRIYNRALTAEEIEAL